MFVFRTHSHLLPPQAYRDNILERQHFDATSGGDPFLHPVLPATDLFQLTAGDGGHYFGKCFYQSSMLFPAQLRPVYAGAFNVTVPRDPTAWLVKTYGRTWETPPTANRKRGYAGVSNCITRTPNT